MLTGSFPYGLVIIPTAFAATLRVITVVAGGTSGSLQVLRVTFPARGAAVIDPAPALVRDPRVRTVIWREPIARGMTRRTIQPEHPGVEGRVAVATRAGGGQPGELT